MVQLAARNSVYSGPRKHLAKSDKDLEALMKISTMGVERIFSREGNIWIFLGGKISFLPLETKKTTLFC